MNKQEIYNFLNDKNIWHEITEHNAVFHMAELSEINIPYPEADAKNIFVRDDKKMKVKLFIDKEFIESSGKRGVHPNDNTATVWLKIEDLINIIKEHGNEVEIVEI